MRKFDSSISLILFISFFSFCSSKNEKDIEIINIIFKNENITINNLSNQESYFHVEISPDINSLPNYIKISVADEGTKFIVNKYFIYYYQDDSTFTSIKQISKVEQQCSGVIYPFIWLNKAQIKNGFYFKLQDDSQKLPYKIEITPIDYCELNLDIQSYTYYITEENKEMSFIFNIEEKEKINHLKDNNTIISWIDSQKEINYELNVTDYIKHSKYNNTFIIRPKQYQKYSLKIKANIGDIINIGFMYIKKELNVNSLSYIGLLYKGFLKRGVIERICFYSASQVNIKLIDDININIHNIITNYMVVYDDVKHNYYFRKMSDERDYYYKCINLPEKLDELFFNIHYLGYFGYPLAENIPSYYSILTGVNYHISIPDKISLGYLPISLEKDFNYLTYHIITNMKPTTEYQIFIADCKDYPSCNINDNIIELKPYFNTYTYIINKSELNNEFFSVNNKKRKILILNCIKRGDPLSGCEFDITIYTDKTKQLYLTSSQPFYKYIKNNTKDNLLITPLDLYHKTYGDKLPVINIDVLSGNILIKANKELNAKYNNIYLYKLNSVDKTLNLKIEAEKDSLYSIKVYFLIKRINTYYAPTGENYLVNFEKGNYGILSFNNNYNQTFTKIKQINSEFTIYNIKKYNFPDTYHNIFYQHSTFNEPTYENIYNSNTKNLIYVMSYRKGSQIILKDNCEENFVFNSENNELNFVYYLINIYYDLIIDIKLYNEGNFNLTLFINDILYNNINHNISKSKNITINFDKLTKFSLNEQINKISFNLKALNIIDDSFIRIKINPLNEKIIETNHTKINYYNNKHSNSDASENKSKNKKAIIIFFICFILIGIAIIIFYKLKKYYKRNNNENFGVEMEEIENNDK